MTAKYLQSIKTLNNRPGAFKIPKAKPYIVDNIFSQAPSEVNSEYEIVSYIKLKFYKDFILSIYI